MQMLKPLAYVSLSLLGVGYFAAFSGLELSPILKDQLALLPVQVGVLAYLLWWRTRRKP